MLGWVEEPMCVHVCVLGCFSQIRLKQSDPALYGP